LHVHPNSVHRHSDGSRWSLRQRHPYRILHISRRPAFPAIPASFHFALSPNPQPPHHLAVTGSLTDRLVTDNFLYGPNDAREICDVASERSWQRFSHSRIPHRLS